MKKHLGALFAGLGLSVLIGFGYFSVRNRTQIVQRGRDIARRGREFAERGRERGRIIARRGRQFAEGVNTPGIDLNTCSTDQLVLLGVQGELINRIVEGRPYRSKLELISRIMVPTDIYESIKHRISVSRPNDDVKVAS